MARKESLVVRIGRATSTRFPSLTVDGTGVYELVSFILAKRNAIESAQRHKIGDYARDYMNTSDFLRPLSNKALGEIKRLGRSDIRRRLREKTYPFSRLSKYTRERLLHLPNSWIYGAADWLLSDRKFHLNH